jgi:hypothetical protein
MTSINSLIHFVWNGRRLAAIILFLVLTPAWLKSQATEQWQLTTALSTWLLALGISIGLILMLTAVAIAMYWSTQQLNIKELLIDVSETFLTFIAISTGAAMGMLLLLQQDFGIAVETVVIIALQVVGFALATAILTWILNVILGLELDSPEEPDSEANPAPQTA